NHLRYETVDSCIQFLYQLDCKHVVTVEGLARDGGLHPVQQALIEHHGSQCGFCTAGFVMALTGLFEAKGRAAKERLQLGVTCNLCRCTGYGPILEAGLALDPSTVITVADQYSSRAMMEDLNQYMPEPVLIETACPRAQLGPARRTFFSPRHLQEA